MPSVKSKVTLGDRAFAIAAPSLWNSLPSELRSITCVTSLKHILRPFFLDMHILNRGLLFIYELVFTYELVFIILFIYI